MPSFQRLFCRHLNVNGVVMERIHCTKYLIHADIKHDIHLSHAGAPERIIDRCSSFLNDEGNVRLINLRHARAHVPDLSLP